MSIQVSITKLKNVLLIKPGIFEDFRGEFVETYNEEIYKDSGINIDFLQDDISVSYKNVFRGLHGDDRTTKLVSCLYGRIYFVVVNCNPESKFFGQWQSFNLSDKNRLQVLIPPLYGVGYLALSNIVIFHYKQDNYYQGAENQFSYQWNDSRFNIWLPIKNPILSKRDEV